MNPKYNIFTNVGVDMLFLLLACLPEAIDRDQVEVFDNPYHDWDQDGFSESNGDCNDNDPNIVEPKEFYMDADGDGFVDLISGEDSRCGEDRVVFNNGNGTFNFRKTEDTFVK